MERMVKKGKKKRRVLAVAPHPDDLEIGCSGTLIKMARDGWEVYLAVMTDGGAGGKGAVRRREQEHAAKLYKTKKIHWIGFEDTRVPVDKESIDLLDAVVRQVKPDMVLAPYAEDTHQDHRHTAAMVLSVTRYTQNVLFYEVPTTVNFLPDVYVDISDVLSKKYEALRRHKSQVRRVNVADLTILDCAKSAAYFRGFQGRVKAAEGFKALRLLMRF